MSGAWSPVDPRPRRALIMHTGALTCTVLQRMLLERGFGFTAVHVANTALQAAALLRADQAAPPRERYSLVLLNPDVVAGAGQWTRRKARDRGTEQAPALQPPPYVHSTQAQASTGQGPQNPSAAHVPPTPDSLPHQSAAAAAAAEVAMAAARVTVACAAAAAAVTSDAVPPSPASGSMGLFSPPSTPALPPVEQALAPARAAAVAAAHSGAQAPGMVGAAGAASAVDRVADFVARHLLYLRSGATTAASNDTPCTILCLVRCSDAADAAVLCSRVGMDGVLTCPVRPSSLMRFLGKHTSAPVAESFDTAFASGGLMLGSMEMDSGYMGDAMQDMGSCAPRPPLPQHAATASPAVTQGPVHFHSATLDHATLAAVLEGDTPCGTEASARSSMPEGKRSPDADKVGTPGQGGGAPAGPEQQPLPPAAHRRTQSVGPHAFPPPLPPKAPPAPPSVRANPSLGSHSAPSPPPQPQPHSAAPRHDVAALVGRTGTNAPSAPTATDAAVRPLRVLVADDNMVNRKVAKRMIERLPFAVAVTVVEDGAQAVAAFCEAAYDIVFMDCQMPLVDGYEATRRIRRHEQLRGKPPSEFEDVEQARLHATYQRRVAAGGALLHTPVVALTAHAMTTDRDKCFRSGMDDYCVKPINFKHLDSVVRKYCGASMGAGGAAPGPSPSPPTAAAGRPPVASPPPSLGVYRSAST